MYDKLSIMKKKGGEYDRNRSPPIQDDRKSTDKVHQAFYWKNIVKAHWCTAAKVIWSSKAEMMSIQFTNSHDGTNLLWSNQSKQQSDGTKSISVVNKLGKSWQITCKDSQCSPPRKKNRKQVAPPATSDIHLHQLCICGWSQQEFFWGSGFVVVFHVPKCYY